jgi:hypothetical protein
VVAAEFLDVSIHLFSFNPLISVLGEAGYRFLERVSSIIERISSRCVPKKRICSLLLFFSSEMPSADCGMI